MCVETVSTKILNKEWNFELDIFFSRDFYHITWNVYANVHSIFFTKKNYVVYDSKEEKSLEVVSTKNLSQGIKF